MILFLDIDGPVIDLHTYKTKPYVSYLRSSCNNNAIMNIVKLCNDFDVKIVTNSMHNYYDLEETLKEDLTRWGIPASMFHEDWRTIFPNVDYKKINSPIRGAGRMYAIEEWLSRHPGYEWICFDDRKFTTNHRLIHIERLFGVDTEYRKQAANIIKAFD